MNMAIRRPPFLLKHRVNKFQKLYQPVYRRPTRTYATSTTPPPTAARTRWRVYRSLLLRTFLCSIAYIIGIKDAAAHADQLVQRSAKPPTYASKADLEKAIEELRNVLGEDAVSTDDDDLHAHRYSEWSSINISTLPLSPQSTEDVATIAEIATKY
jgi:D-lactate dehydrogenase (cytochrome)